MEQWSGFLSGRYSVIVALRGQELVLIHQFLVNAYFYEALSFIPVLFPLFLLPCVTHVRQSRFVYLSHNQ